MSAPPQGAAPMPPPKKKKKKKKAKKKVQAHGKEEHTAEVPGAAAAAPALGLHGGAEKERPERPAPSSARESGRRPSGDAKRQTAQTAPRHSDASASRGGANAPLGGNQRTSPLSNSRGSAAPDNTQAFSRLARLRKMKKKSLTSSSSSASISTTNTSTTNTTARNSATIEIELTDITSGSKFPMQTTPSDGPDGPEAGPRRKYGRTVSEIVNPIMQRSLEDPDVFSSPEFAARIAAAAERAGPGLQPIPWCTLGAMAFVVLLLAIVATSAWGVIASFKYPGKWIPSDSEKCCVWQSTDANLFIGTTTKMKHDALLQNIWLGHFMQFLFAGCLVFVMVWFHQWLHQTGSALLAVSNKSKPVPAALSRSPAALLMPVRTSKYVKAVCTWLPLLGIVWASLDPIPLCLHELKEGGGAPPWSVLPGNRISFARGGGTCGMNKTKTNTNNGSTMNGAPVSSFDKISADESLEKSYAFVDGTANAGEPDRCVDEEMSTAESAFEQHSGECTVVKISDKKVCAGLRPVDSTTPSEWYSNPSRLNMTGAQAGALIELLPFLLRTIFSQFPAADIDGVKHAKCLASFYENFCAFIAPACVSNIAGKFAGADSSCKCIEENIANNFLPGSHAVSCSPVRSGGTCAKHILPGSHAIESLSGSKHGCTDILYECRELMHMVESDWGEKEAADVLGLIEEIDDPESQHAAITKTLKDLANNHFDDQLPFNSFSIAMRSIAMLLEMAKTGNYETSLKD